MLLLLLKMSHRDNALKLTKMPSNVYTYVPFLNLVIQQLAVYRPMQVIREFDVLKMHSYCVAISCRLARSLSHTRLFKERRYNTKVTFLISTFSELCQLPDCQLTVFCFCCDRKLYTAKKTTAFKNLRIFYFNRHYLLSS